MIHMPERDGEGWEAGMTTFGRVQVASASWKYMGLIDFYLNDMV